MDVLFLWVESSLTEELTKWIDLFGLLPDQNLTMDNNKCFTAKECQFNWLGMHPHAVALFSVVVLHCGWWNVRSRLWSVTVCGWNPWQSAQTGSFIEWLMPEAIAKTNIVIFKMAVMWFVCNHIGWQFNLQTCMQPASTQHLLIPFLAFLDEDGVHTCWSFPIDLHGPWYVESLDSISNGASTCCGSCSCNCHPPGVGEMGHDDNLDLHHQVSNESDWIEWQHWLNASVSWQQDLTSVLCSFCRWYFCDLHRFDLEASLPVC